jgi:hypothetical protein
MSLIDMVEFRRQLDRIKAIWLTMNKALGRKE